MSHTIPIDQASARLAELIHALAPGDEIVVTENDKPVARIVPSPPRGSRRESGAWKGLLTIVADDDEHLKDFEDYM